MSLDKRLRDHRDAHRLAFEAPVSLPVGEGRVIGWADGGYLIQEGADRRIKQASTNGAIATGNVMASRGRVDGQGARSSVANPQPLFLSMKTISAVLIQYAWATGRDLDTRTKIVEPLHDTEVGWARGSRDDFEDQLWLLWQGDNTGAGTENVWVKTNPPSKTLTLRLRAFWYAVSSGVAIDLNLYAYSPIVLPTEEALSDLLATVDGDADLPKLGRPIQKLRYRVGPIPTQQSSNIDGDEIGSLTIGRSRMKFEPIITVTERES